MLKGHQKSNTYKKDSRVNFQRTADSTKDKASIWKVQKATVLKTMWQTNFTRNVPPGHHTHHSRTAAHPRTRRLLHSNRSCLATGPGRYSLRRCQGSLSKVNTFAILWTFFFDNALLWLNFWFDEVLLCRSFFFGKLPIKIWCFLADKSLVYFPCKKPHGIKKFDFSNV